MTQQTVHEGRPQEQQTVGLVEFAHMDAGLGRPGRNTKTPRALTPTKKITPEMTHGTKASETAVNAISAVQPCMRPTARRCE